MKLRKHSTHEFCVTNTLGLGDDCLHKIPRFGFVRFLSKKLTPFEIFPGPFTASRSKFFVLFQPFTASRLKQFFSRSNEIRSVSTSRCLARDQNLP